MFELPEDRSLQFLLTAGAVGGATVLYYTLRTKAASSAPTTSPTGFDDYLKARVENPCAKDLSSTLVATSFDAYLKSLEASEDDSTNNSHLDIKASTVPPPASKPVTVLYGTEYGFSKEVAMKTCDKLRQATYHPVLLDMADFPEGLIEWGIHQALLVICSTQGDGVAPTEAREFCDWLNGSSAPNLPNLKYSVAALGDRSYTHFARCGKILDARFGELGAAKLAPRMDVNKEDWAAINTWVNSVVSELDKTILLTSEELGWSDDVFSSADAVKRKWGRSKPYPATVIAIEPLCTLKDSTVDKNTVRIELDLGDSELTYSPGDALGVWPTNSSGSVAELLKLLKLDGDLPVQIPSWHYAEDTVGTNMKLSDVLSRCYDLKTPKLELLALLKASLTGGVPLIKGGAKSPRKGDSVTELTTQQEPCTNGCIMEKVDQLDALLSDAIAAENYFAPRHVVDVLRDFSPALPSIEDLPNVLRPLQPRLYSISSSQKESATRVQLTIAVVTYESLGYQRSGVTSTQVGERLNPGDKLPVYVSRNPDFRLPPDPSTPIIMVGPGTGVAPFRSFMQDRLLLSGDSHTLGEAVLFFGSRRRDQDFLYGSLLEQWSAENKLALFTAFSREGKDKVYVQHRLREAGTLVWKLLETGAHFYVCGDAAHMAGDVEMALLDIIAENKTCGADEAKAYLEHMSSQERYQRDVWF